jgi:hypothetical protein
MQSKPLPKQQPYPSTKIFAGALLYSAFSIETETGIETGVDEWVVRTIRARRNSKTRYGFSILPKGMELAKKVNIVMKNDLTWCKLSKKTGDYGWRPNIPKEFRKQFSVGSSLPFGIYTTKRAALIYCIALETSAMARLQSWIGKCADDEEKAELDAEMVMQLRQIAALQRRLKALAKA